MEMFTNPSPRLTDPRVDLTIRFDNIDELQKFLGGQQVSGPDETAVIPRIGSEFEPWTYQTVDGPVTAWIDRNDSLLWLSGTEMPQPSWRRLYVQRSS